MNINHVKDKDLLRELAKSLDIAERIPVARNMFTPKDTLDFLSKDTDFRVRLEVARNNNTLSSTLDYLSKDIDEKVRRAVVLNHNVSLDALKLLSKDNCVSVRSAIASKRNFSTKQMREFQEILDNLSKDVDKDVRRSVAYNEFTTKDTRIFLSTDVDIEVRRWLASSYATPIDIVNTISKEYNYGVYVVVTRKNNTSREMLDFMYYNILDKEVDEEKATFLIRNIRNHTAVNPDIFERMATCHIDGVRALAADSEKVSMATLERLSNDESFKVRQAIHFNDRYTKPVKGFEDI